MGVDIHAYIECDFQNVEPPFTRPDSVRCMNRGEFFVWRCPDLFHMLGLEYRKTGLPESPLTLDKVPASLSWTILKNHSLILSPHVQQRQKIPSMPRFPFAFVNQWQQQELSCFKLVNHQYYQVELAADELLIFDPGCELPNHASAAEIELARRQCGVEGEKIDYFLSIVEMMKKLEHRLSPQHVRLLYWFDSLSADVIAEYKAKHKLDSNWPTIETETD